MQMYNHNVNSKYDCNETIGKNEIKCTCFSKYVQSNLVIKLLTDYNELNIYGQTITVMAPCPNKLLLENTHN